MSSSMLSACHDLQHDVKEMARLRVRETADEIGEELAHRLLQDIERASRAGRRFLLGCPTGRTPRPIYAAIARKLSQSPQDLSLLTLLMMDEYVVEQGGRYSFAS